jgi:hypothetical protein
MSNCATYLNDHLAGSVIALQLIEHLAHAHAGTHLEREMTDLHAEISADRAELEGLIERLQFSQSPPRKLMAWLTEKLAELKLSMDDRAGGPLHLLEALEAISLGIEGKRSLWRALRYAQTPGMETGDLDRLEQRALEQRNRIEALRLIAAENALVTEPRTQSGNGAHARTG